VNDRTDAFWCPRCWERHELPPPRSKRSSPPCPGCATKLRRCSRFEWFLIDALGLALEATGRDFKIIPQYPVHDHRGFEWYWDLFVWVDGKSVHGGTGLLIDVNGPNHELQPRYSGAGGGYTRDYDKTWEVGQQRFHKRGIDHMIVLNDDCRKKGDAVYATAGGIAKWLDRMADNYT
jgi:hypothetical protein